jgi:DNA-3-methyladenine glycosylase
MYGPPGHAYVYLNYGLHYLVNVVTEQAGSPAAVLIRALEPLDGLAIMRRRRARARTAAGTRRRCDLADERLCSGPGNVTHALGITLGDSGADLVGGALYIEDRGVRVDGIAWSPRIGITVGTERRWRCFVKKHRSVSSSRRSLVAQKAP